MKSEIRLLGIDDSPFTFNEKYTRVVGVVMRGGHYVESVLSNQVSVDGDDSTSVLRDMIENTRHKMQIKAILLDGVALGGFNVVDIEKLHTDTEMPIITITRDKPNFDKIKIALKKSFKDWEKRWNLINQGTLHEIRTSHNPIYVKYIGLSIEEAKEIIKLSTIRGVIPEPIRVAHLIASGIARGESYGKA